MEFILMQKVLILFENYINGNQHIWNEISDANSFEEINRHGKDPHIVEDPISSMQSSTGEEDKNNGHSSKVFFDIVADNEPMGRIEVMLFDDVVPKTVKNFKALAKGIGLTIVPSSNSLK